MVNPHPPLSGFPIVLICILSLLEFLRMRAKDAADWQRTLSFLLLLFLSAVPLTYFSGYFGVDFAHSKFQVPDEAILEHQLWGKAALFLSIGLGLVYFLANAAKEKPPLSRRLFLLYRALLFVLLCVLLRTGFLGGKLVFDYGAAVRLEQLVLP